MQDFYKQICPFAYALVSKKKWHSSQVLVIIDDYLDFCMGSSFCCCYCFYFFPQNNANRKGLLPLIEGKQEVSFYWLNSYWACHLSEPCSVSSGQRAQFIRPELRFFFKCASYQEMAGLCFMVILYCIAGFEVSWKSWLRVSWCTDSSWPWGQN